MGPNVKILDKPLSGSILEEYIGSIYSDLEQMLGCMLENHDTEF